MGKPCRDVHLRVYIDEPADLLTRLACIETEQRRQGRLLEALLNGVVMTEPTPTQPDPTQPDPNQPNPVDDGEQEQPTPAQ
jgi:hypothetical protein